MKKLIRYLFFGSPSKWYMDTELTEETKSAIVEWLNDRVKLHIWLTSVATGSIVFLAALGPSTNISSVPGMTKVAGLGFMLASVLVNIICVWSLSNWKLNINIGIVSDGSRMRLDIEVIGLLAISSFLIGLVVAVVPIII